jgi:phasin family protein
MLHCNNVASHKPVRRDDMTTAKENLNNMKDFGTSGYESMRTLGELNLRTFEQMAEKQMETFGLLIDTGIAQLKMVAEAKDAAGMINGQVQLAQTLSQTLASKSSETMELASKAGEAYRTWLEQGVSNFSGKVEAASRKSA